MLFVYMLCTYGFTISVATRSLSAVSRKQLPCVDDSITNEIVQAVFDENQLVNEHDNEPRYGNTVPYTSTPVQLSNSVYTHSGRQECLSPHSNSSSLEHCHGVVSSFEDSNDSVQFKSNRESFEDNDSSDLEEYDNGFWNHSVSNTMHHSDSSDELRSNQQCEDAKDKMHNAISVLNDNAHRITRE